VQQVAYFHKNSEKVEQV